MGKATCAREGCKNTFDPRPKGHRGREFRNCPKHRTKAKREKEIGYYSAPFAEPLKGRIAEIDREVRTLTQEREALEAAVAALSR